MNQEDDAKDTALSLILMPFILGGGILALLVLISFAEALHISPKLMVFLAALGYFFLMVYIEMKRDEKSK